MQDYTIPPKEKKRGMWPLYGLLMAIAAGAFAYVIGPELIPVVRSITNGRFTGFELPPEQMRLAFMAVTFLVLVTIGALIVAIAMPKKKSRVKENDLRKEKVLVQKEEKRRRARQLIMEQKMKEQNRRTDRR